MRKINIPDYFVYGEPSRALDIGFVHVELISARKNLHRGQVEAHQHAMMAQITYWIKGGGTYEIEDQSWTFSAPAISFVPSGVVHGFAVSEQSDAIVISIANDAIEHIFSNKSAIFLSKDSRNMNWQDIKLIMQMVLKEYQNQQPQMQNVISHFSGVVLDFIMRGAAQMKVPQVKHQPPLAQHLRHLVEQHFRENWTVAHYAEALSTTYHLLDKAAREAFAKPVKQLVVERRMLEAKRLLKFTIRSAENIAYELGFEDPAYFNRQFRKTTGQAPGQWRASKVR